MRIVDSAAIAYQPFSTHRVGRIENKRLLAGQEGTPDNYELSLVLIEAEYATPRHRHNFDQVRVMLKGRFGFGRDRVQEEGSVGYFAEGVHYTQAAMGPSVTLLLQGGGASGQGFMSYRQTELFHKELAAKGSFEGGVYSTTRPDGGKFNKDSYEAIWEACNGRRLDYPAARYDGPIISDPAAFAWVEDAPGIATRHIGSYGERGMGIVFLRLAPGARFVPGAGALLYALSGQGSAPGGAWRADCAIATDGDAAGAMVAEAESTLLLLRLPRFGAAAAVRQAA
jgi:hypothetical protein